MGLFVGIIATIKETRLWVPGLLCGCGCVAVVQLLSRARLFATPWTAARQASLSITSSWSLLMFMSVESVIPSNHLILCRPFLLLPSIFLSIRVFSNESALHIRWPKYWSFSFSIRPSSKYSGLISFRMDWFDLLIVYVWGGASQRDCQTLTSGKLMSDKLSLHKSGGKDYAQQWGAFKKGNFTVCQGSWGQARMKALKSKTCFWQRWLSLPSKMEGDGEWTLLYSFLFKQFLIKTVFDSHIPPPFFLKSSF